MILMSGFFHVLLCFTIFILSFHGGDLRQVADPHWLHVKTRMQTSQSLCNGTPYPNLCLSSIGSVPGPTSLSYKQLVSATLIKTLQLAKNASKELKRRSFCSLPERHAVNNCIGLLENSISSIDAVISYLSKPTKLPVMESQDVHVLLSAVMTNQDTCRSGFGKKKGIFRHEVINWVKGISKRVSNSLAMLKRIPEMDQMNCKRIGIRKFPKWVTREDRKLLSGHVGGLVKVDIRVAQDGSGNFTTINEAIAAAPVFSTTRFVIYVKAGTYSENVDIDSSKTKIMLIGDRFRKTIIRGNRSVVDGWTTFETNTVGVTGQGFIAKSITFVNDAGAVKRQAVAVRSSSDLSVFYKCTFLGYQDTLYVHTFRQFYRDCDIYGTVDIIFGNAAVVFQNCNLYARRPLPNQKITFTAQGRDDPNQTTGISIINCKILASPELAPDLTTVNSYLGRPWKLYSRTVVLNSYIGDLIAPAGWLEWNGTFALNTLCYGEYNNYGEGSGTIDRVKWPGYKVITQPEVAGQFTLRSFIGGDQWVGYAGVPYSLDLD